MNSVAAFLLAFASTLFMATIARYAAGYFASDRASRIAAFGVAIGFAIGHGSYSGPATADDLPAISAALGTIAALVAAWAWLLRKHAGEMTGADS